VTPGLREENTAPRPRRTVPCSTLAQGCGPAPGRGLSSANRTQRAFVAQTWATLSPATSTGCPRLKGRRHCTRGGRLLPRRRAAARALARNNLGRLPPARGKKALHRGRAFAAPPPCSGPGPGPQSLGPPRDPTGSGLLREARAKRRGAAPPEPGAPPMPPTRGRERRRRGPQ
jgi:hypothetical protein